MNQSKENEDDREKSLISLGSSRQSFPIRIVWCILTVFSLIALSYHLSTLIVRFNREPVNIQTSDLEFRFPDIHICPQFPFSDSRIRTLVDQNNKSWLNIADTIKNITTISFSFNASDEEKYDILLSSFWETLTPSLLHTNLSLPYYESLIRIIVNGKGKLFTCRPTCT